MAAWSSDWWSNGWNGPVDPEQDELVKRLVWGSVFQLGCGFLGWGWFVMFIWVQSI